MFTGIITHVVKLHQQNTLTLSIPMVDKSVKLGDSIAINGVCLTVEEIIDEKLFFHLGPVTDKSTNLGFSQYVNIETALHIGDSLGGHFVTGHIDTLTRFLYKRAKEKSQFLYFTLPKNAYAIIPKGSISINGVSLTVHEVSLDTFSVQIIPHTLQNTNLYHLKSGDKVNVEYDILAKYIRGIYEHTRS